MIYFDDIRILKNVNVNVIVYRMRARPLYYISKVPRCSPFIVHAITLKADQDCTNVFY
jgi:hypothetical protein